MNHSALFGREETSEFEHHIRSLLCSDSRHLSLIALLLLVVVGIVRLCQQKHAASRRTLQLHKILMADFCVRRLFRGVYARDRLPTRLPFPSCLIVNTHSSREPGEHWLAVYYGINGVCEFFDSYGRSPATYRLYSYLQRTSRRVTWNRICFQPFDSNACGYYCFLYLMYVVI